MCCAFLLVVLCNVSHQEVGENQFTLLSAVDVYVALTTLKSVTLLASVKLHVRVIMSVPAPLSVLLSGPAYTPFAASATVGPVTV